MCIILNEGYSQFTGNLDCPNFQNFDLSDFSGPNGNGGFAPFNNPNNAFDLEPWFSSHGSPQIDNNRLELSSVNVDNDGICDNVQIGSGLYDGLCGNWGSEGVFYENFTFKEGHVYEISFRATGFEIAETYILLANNYFTHNTNNWQDNNSSDRTYFEVIDDVRSNLDDFFIIWNEQNYNDLTGDDLNVITFIPDKDYNQLWISLYDPDFEVFNDLFQLFELEIWDLQIIGSCIEELVIPDGFRTDEIDNYQKVKITNTDQTIEVFSSNDIDVIAGKQIKITPTSTNSFRTQLGANLNLEIEECYGCEGFNTCQYYIDNDFANVFIPNVFNTCSNGPNAFFTIGHGYPLAAYNAYYAELLIFDGFGNEVYRQDSQAPPNQPLANIILQWDGTLNGQATAADVYAYKLTLINCFNNGEPTEQEFLGTVTKFGMCEGANFRNSDKSIKKNIDKLGN